MSERGSYFVAETTLATIKALISQSEWSSAKELMTMLKREGKLLVRNLKLEHKLFR
jgi:translation initiation factor 2B subunit (eIF-2B alpha/beta/delta family)